MIESNLFTLNFILRKVKREREKKEKEKQLVRKRKKEKRKIKGEVKREEKSDIYPINHVIN